MTTTATSDTKDLGTLPEWDLTDLYPGTEAPDLNADLDRAAAEATSSRERHNDDSVRNTQPFTTLEGLPSVPLTLRKTGLAAKISPLVTTWISS